MAKEVLVAGNFKANEVDAASWLAEFRKFVDVSDLSSQRAVVVCPSFTQLSVWRDTLRLTAIALGAQDISVFPKGPHTGEITGEMLKSLSISHVIIGHSERRTDLGETDDRVAQKLNMTLQTNLTSIVCVGETEEERKAGKTTEVLEKQLRGAFSGLHEGQLRTIVVAYEPLWAIGKDNPATKEDAQRAAAFIREAAKVNKVLYGGSVKPDNVSEFISQPDISGVLVGGASLKGDEFGALAKNALKPE